MSMRVRAVCIAALFLFCTIGETKKNLDSLSSAKELIKNSQLYILQGDRPKACQTLISGLNKESNKSKAYIEITNALKKCTEIFVSEKAQQVYEVAIATFERDKIQSIEKFKEANGIEPHNSLIIKGLIFSLLSQNDCLLAKKNQETLKKINPYDDDVESLKFLQLVCAKNKSEALSIIVKIDPSTLNQPFWHVNKHRLLMEEKNEISLELKSKWPDYPELIYTYWINEKSSKDRSILAEKYKQLCHNPTSFDTAYKYMDPWFCSHTKEIEDYLSKGDRS